MVRRPPRSTLFPTRRSSDLAGGSEGLLPGPPRALRRAQDLPAAGNQLCRRSQGGGDRKSTRLNSSHVEISYAVFCLKKKNNIFKIAHLPSCFSPDALP